MTDNEIRAAVVNALRQIAPEVSAGEIDPAESLREQADLDSMDFLNFVTRLGKDFGIEIPEADYPRLATLDGCAAYLAARAAQPA
jgi:acyl carrier protein